MTDESTAGGVRIAQLLASELTADRDRLADVSVSDADPDVQATPDGALAYRVRVGGADGDGGVDRAHGADGANGAAEIDGDDDDGDRDSDGDRDEQGESTEVAAVFVHPVRARVEFVAAPEAAADAAREAGLRVRPKAVSPPRTVVFVEDGAQVKRVLGAFRAVARDAIA